MLPHSQKNIFMITGAMVRIEKEAPGELPMVLIGCRKHKLECDWSSGWTKSFPAPSKSPSDKLCEKLWSLWEKGNHPKSLDSSCPYIFQCDTPFYKRQKERLKILGEKMGKTGRSDCLPRDDYRRLLNLVQVRINYYFAILGTI